MKSTFQLLAVALGLSFFEQTLQSQVPFKLYSAPDANFDTNKIVEIRATAEKGDAEAQNNLGICYANGQGVIRDDVEAAKWFSKAAAQNNIGAQRTLGVCYSNGRGVTKDEVKAVMWLHKAAEQDDAEAQFDLGVCYDIGEGVAKDEMEKVKWYLKASEQNLAVAQYNIGYCYVNGLGVNADYIEAYKWLALSAKQDDEKAKKGVTKLEAIMSIKQITESKLRVEAWLAQHKQVTTTP